MFLCVCFWHVIEQKLQVTIFYIFWTGPKPQQKYS